MSVVRVRPGRFVAFLLRFVVAVCMPAKEPASQAPVACAARWRCLWRCGAAVAAGPAWEPVGSRAPCSTPSALLPSAAGIETCACTLHTHCTLHTCVCSHCPLAAALKERIGRLLAAVLPVATSGKEKGGGAGYTRSTTISIRSRPAEEQAEENGKRDGAWRHRLRLPLSSCGCCVGRGGLHCKVAAGHRTSLPHSDLLRFARMPTWTHLPQPSFQHTERMPPPATALQLPPSWWSSTPIPQPPPPPPTPTPCPRRRRCLAPRRRCGTATYWSSCRSASALYRLPCTACRVPPAVCRLPCAPHGGR